MKTKTRYEVWNIKTSKKLATYECSITALEVLIEVDFPHATPGSLVVIEVRHVAR